MLEGIEAHLTDTKSIRKHRAQHVESLKRHNHELVG